MKKRVRVVYTPFSTGKSPYDHGRRVEDFLNLVLGVSVEMTHCVTTEALVTIITYDEASI